jgi:hypothetical protein
MARAQAFEAQAVSQRQGSDRNAKDLEAIFLEMSAEAAGWLMSAGIVVFIAALVGLLWRFWR